MIKEPEFFLDKELIYFLKKHMSIKSGISKGSIQNTGNTESYVIDTCIKIKGEEIVRDRSNFSIPKMEPLFALEAAVTEDKKNIKDLIHHLLAQQKRIEDLEKHLSQYTTK